jgi:hypothetical protein
MKGTVLTRCSVAILLALAVADARGEPANGSRDTRSASHQAILSADAGRLNKACGSRTSVRFDGDAVARARQSPSAADRALSRCRLALAGIERICADRDSRDAVARDIKSVLCGIVSERTVSLKDGVLDYRINTRKLPPRSFVREYLQNNL